MKENVNVGKQQHEEGGIFPLFVAVKDWRTSKGEFSPIQRDHAYVRHFSFLSVHRVDLRSIRES